MNIHRIGVIRPLLYTFVLLSSPPFPAVAQGDKDKPAQDHSNTDKDRDPEAIEQARKAVQEFDDTAREAKSASDVVAAVEKLASVKHILVVQKLGNLVTGTHVDAVNVAAAKALGDQGDARAVAPLVTGLSVHGEKGDEGVLTAILHAIGALKDRRAGPAVANLVNHGKSTGVQKAAVEAAGKIHAVEAIDPLLDLLQNASVPDARIRSSRGRGSRTISNPLKSFKEPILKALSEITGQNHGGYDKWKEWWQANRSTFVVR